MKGVDYMDTENQNVTMEDLSDNNPNEEKDELKEAIEETLSNLRTQSMLLGAQAICQTVLDKITAFERKPGSKSNNDHKRLIKEIKNFCEIGVSRKVNTDGTTEPINDTVQN
jgi:hypothetical protein